MPRERILFIGFGSHYGGVETYVEGLAGIVCGCADGYALCSLPQHAARLRAQGLTVVCLPLQGPSGLKALRLLLTCVVVPYMLLRYGIRKVQLNGYFESLLLAPLFLCGCDTVYTMHGPFETDRYSWFRNPARFLPRLLSKQSLRFASQIVCVSEAVGEIARRVLPPHKVTVIPNWVAPPPSPRRMFALSGKPQLLFIGRLEEYKGVQFILEAMRQIPEVSLVVVGEGDYRPQLEALARNLDVRFAGFQPDTSRFYKEATLFVNPSCGPEGLPMVSLEAMACGLPCILSDLPVHREITDNGQAAALFRRGQCASLTRQLRQLLCCEERRRSYGVMARRMIEQRYDVQVAAPRYLQIFGLSSRDRLFASGSSHPLIALADD